MQLEVQWFVSALLSNNLITPDDAKIINRELGGEPDLMTFAQDFLNRIAAELPEEEAKAWMDQIQQVLEFAANQAQSGTPPPDADQYAVDEEVDYASTGSVNALGAHLSQEDMDSIFGELRGVGAMSMEQAADYMKRLLLALRDFGASDLHISASAPLFIRKNLNIQRIDPDWPIPPEDAEKLTYALLSEEQKKEFEENQDLNFALEIHPSRFRASIMKQRQGISASYRIVPDKIHTLEELGFLPHDARTLERLLDYHNGLILVTGPIGSGKTTTLAALVEIANQKREDHIITVEDPIEIVIPSRNCKVTQRQIGNHTNSYRTALKGALREDPDIIVIGEMHDLETIENAITAAETGHLVIGTLPTCDAANTLNRILDVFPPNQQAQIRTMTAGSLRGVVCQKLIPNTTGGLSICYEILMNTLSVSNVISEGKIFQLRASMQIGSKSGMCTIDQNLLALFKANIISYETALGQMRDQSVITQLQQEQAKRVATSGKKKRR